MDPTVTTTTCGAACTVTLVVQIDTPPFNLSESDGALIAGAILAVWAIGYAFRLVIKALKVSDGSSSSTSESE